MRSIAHFLPCPLAPSIALIVAMYAPFVLFGGFSSDDWSVAMLGVHSHGIADSYAGYFLSFSNRPAAPLYYALIAEFRGWFQGYILIDIIEWTLAVFIIARIVSRQFGSRVGYLFMPFALLPTLSSTMIFSPAMQSIGVLSILLWATAFYLLDRAIDREKNSLIFLSNLSIALMLSLYEVAMPLLALSLLWPLIRCKKRLTVACRDRLFITNACLTCFAVLLMLIYQKLIAPLYFDDISRMRAAHAGQFYDLILTNTRAMRDIITASGPHFWSRAIGRLFRYGSTMEQLAWLGSLVFFVSIVLSPPANGVRPSRWAFVVWGIALIFGMFAVGIMHAGALMTPTIIGYTNRGLGAESILLPLAIATVCGRVDRRLGLVIAGVLFAGYSASFAVQSDNYIKARAVRDQVFDDISRQIHNNGPTVILGDIPEFLPQNFNNETIFANDLHDFSLFLRLKTGDALSGEIITKAKTCSARPRVGIGADTVVVDESSPVPLNNALFYTYGQNGKAPVFVPLHNGDDLKQIIGHWGECPAP